MTDRLRDEAWKRGELRHEKCRWGILSESFSMNAGLDPHVESNWEPGVCALCAWQPPQPTPPALARRWGGDIEFDRDCALCDCFEEVPLKESSND